MKIVVADRAQLGTEAAALGADAIHAALARTGTARIILATRVNQFAMLDHLVATPDIDWSRVTAFHLDEYIGLPHGHPASFCRFLEERVAARVPAIRFVPIDGNADPAAEIVHLGALIDAAPVDVSFARLGENCHFAFNDPPAYLEADAAYIPVTLDEACRRQQLGEGWFPAREDVPARAISMSERQIMRSAAIVLSVPEARKARAVRDMMTEPVTPLHPASILRQHADTTMFLDLSSAALL